MSYEFQLGIRQLIGHRVKIAHTQHPSGRRDIAWIGALWLETTPIEPGLTA